MEDTPTGTLSSSRENNEPQKTLPENPGCLPSWAPRWVTTALKVVLGEHWFAGPPPENPYVRLASDPGAKNGGSTHGTSDNSGYSYSLGGIAESFSSEPILLEENLDREKLEHFKAKVKVFWDEHREALRTSEQILPEVFEVMECAVTRFLSECPGYGVTTNAKLPGYSRAMFSFRPTQVGLHASVKLPGGFDIENKWDLIQLIHELTHADQVCEMHERLGHTEFTRRHNEESKCFGSKAFLLYSEVRAWLITLLLADHVTDGALQGYIEEAAPLHEAGNVDATRAIFERRLPKFIEALGVAEADRSNAVRLMRLASAVFTSPVEPGKPWRLSFVSEVARDHARMGLGSFGYIPADATELPDGDMEEYLCSPAQTFFLTEKNGKMIVRLGDI